MAAYKVLDLELNASEAAIEHWYHELSLLNQPDRCRAGSSEQQRVAEKRRQIDAAYRLIQHAPLYDHRLAQEAAEHEQERVPDPGFVLERQVSVATEVIVRFVLGVVVGLLVAASMNTRGVPGFEIYVWGVPLVLGILFMSSERPVFGGRDF